MTNMISTKRALRQEAQENTTTRGLREPHAKRPKRAPHQEPQEDTTPRDPPAPREHHPKKTLRQENTLPREHVAKNFCFEMKSLEKKKNLERNLI